MARRRLLNTLCVVCLVYCFLLVTDATSVARGHFPFLPTEWYFPWLRLQPRLLWVAVCGAATILYVVGSWRLVQRGSALRLKLWAFAGASLLPILVAAIEGAPLFTLFGRLTTPALGGYSIAAGMVSDPGEMLRDWLDFSSRFRALYPVGGVTQSPPGLPLMFYSSARAFEAVPPLAESVGTLFRSLQCQNPDLLQWSDAQWASSLPAIYLPLWSGLAIAPLYRLAARLFSRKTALWAVALYPLVPSLAIFGGRVNTFYALLCAALLVFVWEGLIRRRFWLIGSGGFVVGMGTFMNFATVPMGLIGGFSILVWWWRGRPGQRRALWVLVRDLTAFGVGAGAIWLIYGGLTGITPLAILNISFERHYELIRPYLLYLLVHPYEMFLFTGIPIAALALWRIGTGRRLVSHADLFAAAGALSLFAITLSGTARGETARVWICFAPIWVVLAADVLANTQVRAQRLLIGLQIVVFLSMSSVFYANFHIYTPVPNPPTPSVPPAVVMRDTFALNGDQITLLGWRAEPDTAGVTLHLYWQVPQRQVRQLYQLALIPRAPDGTLRDSLNWIPYARNYPPSCWTPGKVFEDTVSVPLTERDPSGEWWFSLAIIHLPTRQPMQVNGADTQIGIGAVNWP